MSEKIPTTIITGFLGAGKTTLIRHLLQNAGGRKLALIVNEFGDIGVDGEILKACGAENCAEEDIIELANGCICCTVADDFIPTMTKLLDRPQKLDHIIIETSGLALPQPLVRAFNWPEIRSRVTVDGVITVVDAKALSEGRFADDEAAVAAAREADPNLEHENPIEELFEDQLNCADLVVMNKADLVNESALAEISEKLKSQLRKGTKLIATQQGAVDPVILLGLAADAAIDLPNRLSHHEMEGEQQHDHDDFITFIVDLPPGLGKSTILARIANAIESHNILRVKGFAAVPGSDARLLVQAVGPRLDAYFDRPWRNDEKRETRLVVIGEKSIDQSSIQRALQT